MFYANEPHSKRETLSIPDLTLKTNGWEIFAIPSSVCQNNKKMFPRNILEIVIQKL